jgi:hypothetical protein
MKSEILTLCEYASENNGRLTIVDSFDAIVATKLPWRAYFSVASKIDLMNRTCEYETVTMKIVSASDSDKVIFEASNPFNHPESFDKLNLVANFKGLIFEVPGKYLFRILFDSEIVAECMFKVILKKNE